MREIRFRGKRTDTKEWVYGYLADGDMICNWSKDRISYEVIPHTVGQFTGLHDKNGKEIYEGDIIRSFDSEGEPIIHSVVWCGPCAKFSALLDSNSKYGRTYCDLDKDWIDKFCKEVFGNIYDNQEFLKGGNK